MCAVNNAFNVQSQTEWLFTLWIYVHFINFSKKKTNIVINIIATINKLIITY